MDRTTIVEAPAGSEVLTFSPDEASLCIQALGYYVTTETQSMEANWDTQAYFSITGSAERASVVIQRTASFLKFQETLANKFTQVVDEPETTVELSQYEILALGEALFRLGTMGLTRAEQAIEDGKISYKSEEDLETIRQSAQQTSEDARAIFQQLEPIAKSKESWTWPLWNEQAVLAAPSPARPTGLL